MDAEFAAKSVFLSTRVPRSFFGKTKERGGYIACTAPVQILRQVLPQSPPCAMEWREICTMQED